MSEVKIHVSFRPDQADLVVSCLEFVRRKLDEDSAGGAHKHVSGPFTFRRITEVIALFEQHEPQGERDK